MKSDCVLNFGMRCDEPLDLRSRSILRFAEEVVRIVPELDQVKRDAKKGEFELFQRGKERRPREVEITEKGVQAAGGMEISIDERVDFVMKIGDAAELLEISKLNLSIVDVRFVFPIKHWGNHHDLVAKALFAGSPLCQMVRDFNSPLDRVDLSLVTRAAKNEDLVLVTSIDPKTVRREIRSGRYEGDEIVVICGVARTGGFVNVESFRGMLAEILDMWADQMESVILTHLVQPLQRFAIAEEPEDNG